MRYGVHVVVFGLLGVGFGVSEIVAPGAVLSAYGLGGDAGSIVVTRLGAALNIGFGLAALLSRKSVDPIAQRAVLVAGVAYALVATAVSVQSALAGTSNAMMWSMLLITLPMAGNAVRLLLGLRGAAAVSGG